MTVSGICDVVGDLVAMGISVSTETCVDNSDTCVNNAGIALLVTMEEGRNDVGDGGTGVALFPSLLVPDINWEQEVRRVSVRMDKNMKPGRLTIFLSPRRFVDYRHPNGIEFRTVSRSGKVPWISSSPALHPFHLTSEQRNSRFIFGGRQEAMPIAATMKLLYAIMEVRTNERYVAVRTSRMHPPGQL